MPSMQVCCNHASDTNIQEGKTNLPLFFFLSGLSDENGTMSFYRKNDKRYEEWGFSVKRPSYDSEEVSHYIPGSQPGGTVTWPPGGTCCPMMTLT